jgi:alpha-1,6-mannosyltransferase
MLRQANKRRQPFRLVVPAERSRVEAIGEFGRLYHVKAPRAPIVDSRYRLMLPHAFLRPGGEVRRIVDDERPDVIEICDKYSLCYLAGLLRRGWHTPRRRPTLVGLSCERLDDSLTTLIGASGLARRLARSMARGYIGRIYAGQFDYHIANSEYTARELRERLVAKHRRDVHVVPMGVDLTTLGARYRSAALRARWQAALDDTTDDTVWLLYAGRLSPEKNLPLLIDTIATLARDEAIDYRLVIAGDGPTSGALRREAEQRARGRVFFEGHVADRQALARIYASCDVFVHPNPREPFGIGPLEAMASGVPLVAPHAGGVLSYATRANAWLAEPTGEDFADAVRAATTRGPARNARIADGLETAAAYGWDIVTGGIFQLYETLHAQRTMAEAETAGRTDLPEEISIC